MNKKPDFDGFAKAIMTAWPEGGVDGFDLHDLAVKHQMIAEVPGGYDPDAHFDSVGVGPEPGDQWFEPTYTEQPTNGEAD